MLITLMTMTRFCSPFWAVFLYVEVHYGGSSCRGDDAYARLSCAFYKCRAGLVVFKHQAFWGVFKLFLLFCLLLGRPRDSGTQSGTIRKGREGT